MIGLFDRERPEHSISEISRSLGIHKSTAHYIAKTLCKLHVLEQNPSSLKYHLGPALVRLGYLARQQVDLPLLARPYLDELSSRTHTSIFLGIFENDGITIVEKAESPDELRISAPIGQRVPYCGGSFGRAFLAFMPSYQVDRLIGVHGLRRFTETSITDPHDYTKNLAAVREIGYAVDDTEEYLNGVWAVSVPIFENEEVAAVLTSVTFKAQITPERAGEIIQGTVSTAQAITRHLGTISSRRDR
jgi:DNA-binding IclR family transcriptional regulator